MPAEITMPQLSDTMTEGTVNKWFKNEGDTVKAGDVIAEIETDKANMDMEAFEGGTVAVVLAEAGAKVAVGEVIAVLATGRENAQEIKKQYAGRQVAASAGSAKSVKVEDGGTAVATLVEASNSEIRDWADTLHGATREDIPPHREDEADDDSRIKISPLARRIAISQKIDITQIKGTGPNGRIIQRDVLAFAESGVAESGAAKSGNGAAAMTSAKIAPMSVPIQPGEKKTIALTKMRQTIALRLQQAKQQIPHIYLSIDIEMDAVNSLREKVNQQLEPEKIRVSLADFIARGVAAALVKHPALNAHFDAKNEQIIQYADVHLGNAVALPDGLIVPVLRNVQRMGLRDLRQKSADLFERAKQQKLKRDELSGATFTITNLGQWGIKEFSAIVNPPEVAILAVSAAEKRAVIRNDQIVSRTIMTVTLSTDHRAVDGATAAEFLKTLKSLLEEPGMMLV